MGTESQVATRLTHFVQKDVSVVYWCRITRQHTVAAQDIQDGKLRYIKKKRYTIRINMLTKKIQYR